MKLINPNAAKAVDFTLECDPAKTALGEAKAVFAIKPLTRNIIDKCATDAGKVPWNGRKVTDRIAGIVKEAGKAWLEKNHPDVKPAEIFKLLDDEERGKYIRARMDAEFSALEALDDRDRLDLEAAQKWTADHEMNMVCTVVETVDGVAVNFREVVENIRPNSLVQKVIDEIIKIALALANLDDEGKVEFARLYGLITTAGAEDGSAQTATETQLSIELGDGAAAH